MQVESKTEKNLKKINWFFLNSFETFCCALLEFLRVVMC